MTGAEPLDTWNWEPVDVKRSGATGDLSKLFKNVTVKEPGALAMGAPPASATLLAREVIQNSWDAARELRHQKNADLDFGMEFHFRTLTGSEKTALARELGLGELAERVEGITANPDAGDPAQVRRQLGLRDRDCLDRLSGDEPLRILEIREEATTGMYGPFEGTKSKLYLALVSVGFTAKEEGAGGSYGYGKAGLIRGSATRTVLAYTCFEERPDDPEVTRRLLGMTYWGRHDLDGSSFTGFARLGTGGASGVTPFENEEADEIASRLGLSLRDPSRVEDLGTTFLLVDPTVEPEGLCTAIERNWWPALDDHAFAVEIHTPDGDVLIPRPKKSEFLASFIRGYELATVTQDSPVEGEWSKAFSRMPTSDGEHLELGRLGLVADQTGWSYPTDMSLDEEDEGIRHRSLVALVRGPRMVVEYLEAGHAMPFVRGCFVAHERVDDLLRQTEPSGHDSWQTRPDTESIDPDAPQVADRILRTIKRHVADFRRLIKPPAPERKDIRLPELEKLFRQILEEEGSGVSGPEPGPRLVAIRISEQAIEPVNDDQIRFRGRATVNLSDHVEEPETQVDLRVKFVFIEDGRSGEQWRLNVEPPGGFDVVDAEKGVFTGRLGHEPRELSFISDPYRSDWTGKLSIVAEPVATSTKDEAA